MNVYVACGKGGVGKTNCSVALAIDFSLRQSAPSLIIDYDGGHSVGNTLGFDKVMPVNSIFSYRKNLSIAVIENSDYIGIIQCKAEGKNLATYFRQFPGDLGLLPLADMVNAFFGVPTDISTLQKFSILVRILSELRGSKCENIIIDVEPTAGLERLLLNAESTVRSLKNLQKQGILSLAAIGAKWPDIASYLRADYIRNAEHYCKNIEFAVDLLRKATYLVVTTPEMSPVMQTFEVRRIIKKFGGKVQGYVINNIREEAHERACIAILKAQMLPIAYISRQDELHDHPSVADRIKIFSGIGEKIFTIL